MRATLSGYYRNLQFDQNRVAKELFDVTKQISSGQKIQYAYEDNSVFIDTVRLDNEVTTLTQTEQNAQKALQFSTNTDTTMNEMTKILDSMKVDLIYAANGAQSQDSLNAIALELRGLEENFKQLANTSIDGKYLFSGTEITTKPIDENGIYQGNDKDINAHLGSGLEQKYNVSGADLFLGVENGVRREVTTNISLYDANTNAYAQLDTTLEDITGSTSSQFFYIRGTNHDGSTFKNKIELASNADVSDVLKAVEASYASGSVNVSLNNRGTIVVQDKLNGSSKLDFHMVAGTTDETDIDALVPTSGLEFIKSGLDLNATGADSAVFDRTFFSKDGSVLTSNVSQVIKSNRTDADGNDISNNFATDTTKLHEVFSGVTYDALGGYVFGLNGQTLNIEGTDIGGNPYTATLNLLDAGSTFTINGTTYTLYNAESPQTITDAKDVSYRQLMDIVNMAVTNSVPAGGSVTDYNNAVNTANSLGTTSLSYDGKITFNDKNNIPTSAELSIYDANSNSFPPGGVPGSLVPGTASVASFNANNALTVSDPKTDFFKQIDDLIKSVELGRINTDGNGNDPRNIGVENSIEVIDSLLSHLGNQHSVAGSQSQTLERTIERTQLLVVTTKTLRSETIDVDIAEASLDLKQLELSYQAMLSSVSKISQLSLVNYL